MVQNLDPSHHCVTAGHGQNICKVVPGMKWLSFHHHHRQLSVPPYHTNCTFPQDLTAPDVSLGETIVSGH